jgi:transcriptional regulator with XRE-family HTH domain
LLKPISLQMLIQERLQLILKMHNLTPSAFADKLGVQRSNVSHVISGRNKPSLDFLEKIILNFPRVNAHWLLTGEMSTSEEVKLELKKDEKNISEKAIAERLVNDSIVRIVEFYKDGTFKEYLPK